MAITLSHEPDGYRLSVSPPHGVSWSSDKLLTAFEVMVELAERGCHLTDAMDALTDANPKWTEAYDAEVIRRRSAHATHEPLEKHP